MSQVVACRFIAEGGLVSVVLPAEGAQSHVVLLRDDSGEVTDEFTFYDAGVVTYKGHDYFVHGVEPFLFAPTTPLPFRPKKARKTRRRIKDWLTTQEVARMLDAHVNTVRRWSDSGVIPCHRIGPRRDRRFKRSDIKEFLGECRQPTTNPKT